MDQEWLFYKLMDDFLEKDLYQLLDEKRILAVEIPESEKMYYVVIESYHLDSLGIMLFKGSQGLKNIMMSLDKKARTVDLNQRSSYIGISFKKEFDQLPKDFLDYQKKNGSSALTNRGFPVIYLKEKAYKPVPISMDLSKDVIEVLTALTSVSLKNLKKVHRIHQNTVLDTLFKKDDQWQREKRKVKLVYPKINFSPLESYPLMKATKATSEIWHITSLYASSVDERDKIVRELGAPCYPGSVSVTVASGETIYFEGFIGPAGELPKLKGVIVESFKKYNIRPERIVTDLRMIYHALEDFAKALGIQLIYNPADEVLGTLAENFLGKEMESKYDLNAPDQEMFYYFLNLKGISRRDFNNLPKEASDDLMEAFDSAMTSVEAKFEWLLKNPETASFMGGLSEDELKQYMIDMIKTHFRNLNKG